MYVCTYALTIIRSYIHTYIKNCFHQRAGLSSKEKDANKQSSAQIQGLLYTYVNTYILGDYSYPHTYIYLQPWEILPLGTAVSGYVCGVDSTRQRVELTTFSPETWEEMMPRKSEATLEDGNIHTY